MTTATFPDRQTRANGAAGIADAGAVRLGKFRALVRHAAAHSPYYARIMGERRLTAESCMPADFPVLTKAMLMENFDEIVTDRRITKQRVAEFLARSTQPTDRLFGHYTVMNTSGTSGEVGYCLYAPSDYARLSGSRLLLERLRPPRRFFRRLRIALYSSTGGHSSGITSLSRLKRGLKRLLIRAAAFEVNVPMATTVRELNRFKPDILIGYTTALRLLGEEQCGGRLRIAPFAVVATGEMVTPGDLAQLRAEFNGADAVSVYACTEHTLLGLSNRDGETMTLFDGSFIFEPNEDHSLVTNLANFTMPMIRYRTSDILQPLADAPPGAMVIRTVIGRGEQLAPLLNDAGEQCFLNPHTLSALCVTGVRRVQIRLTGLRSFRLLYCLDPAASAAVHDAAHAAVNRKLLQVLRQKGLANVHFEMERVPDIPVNERTRKYQFIVDARGPEGVQRGAAATSREVRESITT